MCIISKLQIVVIFFFQAEDGIRDYDVTGVQTCALPILPKEIDNTISQLQLEALNVKIDSLSKEQIKYLESWEEGT